MARRFTIIPKRFRKNERGAAAVEFAIVSVPFLGLLFGTIDLAAAHFFGDVLESNLNKAARTLRTGEAQRNGTNEQAFKSQICDGLQGLGCSSALTLTVTSSPNLTTAVNSGSATGTFQVGNQNDWHFVQISMTRSYFTPFLSLLTNNGSSGSLSEYTIVRNQLVSAEPFGATGG